MTDLIPTLPLLVASASNAALVTFVVYIASVFGLAIMANRLLQKRNFLSEYYLGSRSLGIWALALTFAATSASGGSFTGFPSKIYMHGWILGLWIGSYMVVPLCAMGLIGKRINQVARISGAITVPDVLRDRFRSPVFGLLCVALLVFFMSFNLVGQFKAGSEILKTLLQDVPAFATLVGWAAGVKAEWPLLAGVETDYLLCLLMFALAVILYTTYGGFHAVVWTDVMQGIVMVGGVLILLPLALVQVGGLERATRQMAEMTPPRLGHAQLALEVPSGSSSSIAFGWIQLEGGPEGLPRLLRVNGKLAVPRGRSELGRVEVVELTTPGEIRRQWERLHEPRHVAAVNRELRAVVEGQLRWLAEQPGGEPGGEQRSRQIAERRAALAALQSNPVGVLNPPGVELFDVRLERMLEYVYGSGQPGVYVSGPGPLPPVLPRAGAAEQREPAADESPGADESPAAGGSLSAASDALGFLPLSLAISFFFMWAITGAGQPSSMVRLMAFRNSLTLRRAIFTVAIYFSLIYFPLVIIFCCARVLLPGMDLESDRIMPQVAVTLTGNIGQPWLAGLLIAAPFAAVMSTVDSFLLMISSGLVRDIYQRNVNPQASRARLKALSYLVTLTIGLAALIGAINPPRLLQDLIVYTTSGMAACFLGPMVFALYWPRANQAGCVAGMLAGFAAHLSLYVGGIFVHGSFYRPVIFFNLDPILVGLAASFLVTYLVALVTPPPPEDLVRKYFCRQGPAKPTA